MEIIREGTFCIKKEIVSLNKLDDFDSNKLKEATPLLIDTIENSKISTFGLITILRKKYEKSLLETYKLLEKENYDSVKCNCYYLAKILKEKLYNLGIDTNYLTHKAHFFALNSGDSKIKEAHISLLYPTIKNDKLFYIIFDPGLKIDAPLCFYANESMKPIQRENLSIDVCYDNSDINYPYYINMDGINPYSYTTYPHNIFQKFNPNYKTTNIDEMLYPISYNLLTGYKAITFSKDKFKRAYIILKHLDRTLEFCDLETNQLFYYNYNELKKLGRNILKNKIFQICLKLSLDTEEILDNIYFMIDIHNEFLSTIMDKDVLTEYTKKRNLKK